MKLSDVWFPVVAAAVVLSIGCAHGRPDPFLTGSHEIGRERASPPECFSAPLASCLSDPTARDPIKQLASPWREIFEPDLTHRICRGETDARRRWLDGARQLPDDDPRGRIYLQFLDGCSTPDFCSWAIETVGSELEPVPARRLVFESARRWCGKVLEPGTLQDAGANIGQNPDDMSPWISNSREAHCVDTPRFADPWQDMVGLQSTGCLDLGDWIEYHRETPDATASALERCINGSEIRYQEANCLRELAGLDRARAVALVRSDDRRGWGTSSKITRYGRTLLRFPEEGQLESELGRLGLLPTAPPQPVEPGRSPVLPFEVLEHHGRLAVFNPGCSVRYCEHAPLMYQLIDLVSPILDDVVLEERWPALEEVDLGSGPKSVSTSVGGIPVTLRVGEDPTGSFDREDHERLRARIEDAREQPHQFTAYSNGRAYRLPIRNLGEWYDLETMLAGLNTILADRDSDLRFATLEPHCVPCAQVVAGPGDGLIEAAFSGLIEVTDPFKELWTQRNFDPQRLER